MADDPTHASLSGLWHFLTVAVRQVRPYWKEMLVVVLASIPQVALETAQPMLLMVLINAIVAHDNARVWMAVSGLVALVPIYITGNFLFEYMASRVGAAVSNDLRMAAFWRLQALSVAYHRGRSRGDLLSRFSSDLDAVERSIVTDIPFALSCLLSISVGVVLMLSVEWRLGLTLCALLPLVIIGPRWLGARASQASYVRQRDAAVVMGALEESIAAHAVIKTFDLQGILLAGFGKKLSTLYRSTVRASLLSGLQGSSISGSGSILLVLSICLGAVFAVRGSLSVGGLVATFDLLWFVVANLNALSKVVPPMQRASGGMTRIQEVLSARESVADRAGAHALPPFSDAIQFDNVHYDYAGVRVLTGIRLTIRRGESILIVGPSGSGKSTLLSLILRMDDPVIGTVSIDGHDLREVTQVSLRMRMGVVFQESVLLDTTVRENIRLGNPEASDAAIESAARDAGIHDVIAALPNGYDTRLGGGAANLSGGERQRVAIARALVREPTILILDEPASALDAQAEAAINRTLRQVAKGRTLIAVTHRLAPAATDRILVLSGGQLVEDGTHAELIALGGVYAELWRVQHQSATVE